jgi:hypothetical protein
VSPWRILGLAAAAGWASLRRRARAVREATLLTCMRTLPDGASLRAVAVRAATMLAAYALSVAEALPISTRAFMGAAHVT